MSFPRNTVTHSTNKLRLKSFPRPLPQSRYSLLPVVCRDAPVLIQSFWLLNPWTWFQCQNCIAVNVISNFNPPLMPLISPRSIVLLWTIIRKDVRILITNKIILRYRLVIGQIVVWVCATADTASILNKTSYINIERWTGPSQSCKNYDLVARTMHFNSLNKLKPTKYISYTIPTELPGPPFL
jgi:hypothetical protein